jgi:hypothetical protein
MECSATWDGSAIIRLGGAATCRPSTAWEVMAGLGVAQLLSGLENPIVSWSSSRYAIETMTDPAPLMSTIAASSATMVAIVGGLLVARFVTIDSEQQGAQQLLDDARNRLATAQKREQEAKDNLYRWDVRYFFDDKVIEAIGDGERDVSALSELGGYTSLTDEQLAEVVQTIATEFDTAQRVLEGLLPNIEGDTFPEWDELKRSKREQLPDMEWEHVWEVTYDKLTTPPQPPWNPVSLAGLNISPTSFLPPTAPEFGVLSAQRRDTMRANLERAEQRVEDIESEVAHLTRAREAIVRPKGLGWGLVVLAYFTLSGVIFPIWLMSRAPRRLTAGLGEIALWVFLSGLLALLGYMTVLALRLSGWWQKWRKGV